MHDVRPLSRDEITAHLGDVAALRIAVFRDWPYLYDGNLDHERQYVASYRDHPGALLVAAFDTGRLIGASTSTPLEDQSPAIVAALRAVGLRAEQVLWGPESALLAPYRGKGIGHRFFDHREAHARAIGRSHVAFASILRREDHPARPVNARSNDAFWQGRGYAPLPGARVEFGWKDVGDASESLKTLQIWLKAL